MSESEPYPGKTLGLPESGPGSLAPWRSRVAALVVDWAASMVLASALFGTQVLTGHGWRSFTIMAVFFVESAVLTATLGGSFGQLLARIAIVRLDGKPLAWWQALVRTGMKCLVIPAVVVGAERRSMLDLTLGTVVVNRR